MPKASTYKPLTKHHGKACRHSQPMHDPHTPGCMLLSPCGWDAAGVILNRSTRTISFTRNGVHLGLAVSAGEICKELDLDKINLMIWVEGIEELVYNFGTDPSLPFASPMDDIYCDEEELHCKGKACMGYGARGWGGGWGWWTNIMSS